MVGENVFRILACQDTNWKQYGFNKADQLNLTTVQWLNQDRIIAGTDDGRLLIVESGDLKCVFYAQDLILMQLKSKDE